MKTILVVDDEYAILDAVRAVLEDEGFSVVTASDGKEALETIEAGPAPDLILIDVMMPVMDGRQAIESLQKASTRVPVIMMSAAPTALEAGKELGVEAVLQKPFSVESLLETLRSVLDREPV
jgi:two-component system OmpR family response regulator/two-component system alkaline phosphatase synthesis response regulator PhoP